MKNITRLILLLAIGSFFSVSAYSQGSGSTEHVNQNTGAVEFHSFETNKPDFSKNRPSSFEVIKAVKGNLVKLENGLLSLKTKKGKLVSLKVTPETEIAGKKNNKTLANGKFIKVSYKPEKSKKAKPEAVFIKILK